MAVGSFDELLGVLIMKYLTIARILSVFPALAHGANYQVATGLEAAGGAVYSPDALRVQPGDTIEFILIGVSLFTGRN